MGHDLNPKNLDINGIFFFFLGGGQNPNPSQPYFWGVLGQYPQNEIFFKKSGSVSLLPFRHPKPNEKFQKKSYEPLWRKRVYLLTY